MADVVQVASSFLAKYPEDERLIPDMLEEHDPDHPDIPSLEMHIGCC